MAYQRKFNEAKVFTSWIKVNSLKAPCFIGTDAVGFGDGSHIVLTNLITGKEIFYRADGPINGDGVNCLAGHKSFNIFAFAEKGQSNRIIVLTYPECKIIARLSCETEKSNYICLAFSEKEYLIALSGLPDYKIQVWYWRTEEMVASRKTEFYTNIQRIALSPTSPLVVCQIAYTKSLVKIWEIHGAGKFTELIERRVEFPQSNRDENMDLAFSIDGSVNIIDKFGTVYHINTSNGDVKKIITWPEEVDYSTKPAFQTHVAYFRAGLILIGPDGLFKHFKKEKQIWVEMFSITPPEAFTSIRCFELKEELYGITVDGTLMKMYWEGDATTFKRIKTFARAFTLFVMLNPLGDYVVTVNEYNVIMVLSIESGEAMSSIHIDNHTTIREHPFYPYIAIGDNRGVVHIVSITKPAEPKIATEFHLSHATIQKISFTEKGTSMIVNDVDGNYFEIDGLPGGTMNIVRHIKETEYRFINFILAEVGPKLIIIGFITPFDSKELKSQGLLRLSCDKNGKVEKKFYTMEKHYLHITKLVDEHEIFFAVPHLSTEVHLLKLPENEEDPVEVIETIHTFHQVRFISAYATVNHLLTWGIDGVLSVYEVKTRKLLIAFVVHNRQLFGVARAAIDPLLQNIVSLSVSGNMTCTRKLNSPIDPKKQEQLKMYLRNQHFIAMDTKPTIGFKSEGENEGKCYLEIVEELRIQKEQEVSITARKRIWEDFELLRAKIKKMIDTNEGAPPEEILPLQSFDLNKEYANQQIEQAAEERKKEDERIKRYITTQSIIIERLKQMCWKKSETKPSKLRGIFTKLKLENYPIEVGESSDKRVKDILFWRQAEMLASHEDALHPWNPMGTSELENLLGKPPQINDQNNKLLNEGDTQSEVILPIYYLPLSGTSTHNFVDIFPLRYQQMEVISYNQVISENILGNYDIYKLRVYFNKIFKNMEEVKSHDMKLVLTRNERLRKIQDEINILSELRKSTEFSNEIIVDPEYCYDERPGTIVEVEQHEVPVLPYISPSMQKELDAQAAERERIRLEKLADDFKERALMAMMDGVLEKLWEDEIKKTPPPPECILIEKDPGEYTADDLRDIQEYEDTIDFLKSERERYRQMLYAERIRIHSHLLDQIQKFNMKVGETLLTKMKVEAAICQEEFKLIKHTQYLYQRQYRQRYENELKIKIDRMQNDLSKLETTVALIRDQKEEIRNTYDFLRHKDSMMEKDFKLHFGENLTSSMLNQSFKLFRKRPVVKTLVAFTVPTLLDISRRVVSKDLQIDALLLPEVIDLLSALDAMDSYSHAPNGLDAHNWEKMCIMRRNKIESEYKLKSHGEMLADAEHTSNAFNKEINMKKNQLIKMEQELAGLIKEKEDGMLNRAVQIVLKKGLVEVALTGRIEDFHDCILIHRSDVDDINIIIKKAGLKKLAAMKHAAIFRRKVIVKEHEHKILKMTVRDLKDFIDTIERCAVTKEVQMWLKRKERGWPEDLTQMALDREIQGQINTQERILADAMKQLKDIETKIEEKINENKKIDKKIQEINLIVAEKKMKRDVDVEQKELKGAKMKMREIILRSNLVQKIQHQHTQILELSTLLELQRLKTYPTLTAHPHNPVVSYKIPCPRTKYLPN